MTTIQTLTDMFNNNIIELNTLRALCEAANNSTDENAKYLASNNYHAALNFHNTYFQILIHHHSENFLRQIVPLWSSDMMRPYHLKRAEVMRDFSKKLKPFDARGLILEFLGFR